jgi:hypothetical protein
MSARENMRNSPIIQGCRQKGRLKVEGGSCWLLVVGKELGRPLGTSPLAQLRSSSKWAARSWFRWLSAWCFPLDGLAAQRS